MENYVWLVWPLIGGLVGLAAAQRKGFSVANGFVGGLLLGLLSPLLFLVSSEGKKCPWCAEQIKKEARVCPKCQRDQATAAA